MFKKIAAMLHLWLGFIAGLVLVLSLVPASIFVFDKELTNWWYHQQIFVDVQKAQALPVSVLIPKAQAALGAQQPITGIELTNNPQKTFVFTAYKQNKKPGITFFSEYEYGQQVYINPYTGKVQGVINMKHNWIYLCRVMHQQMLLRYDIGHWFIGVASLILFVSLITGFILWFPKSKAAVKQRFSIKWDARWRRKNYDVHNVGGFYSMLLIFLLAATGLVWSFQWWSDAVYRLMGDDPKKVFTMQPVAARPSASLKTTPIDKAYDDVLTKRVNWTELYIGLPGSVGEDNDSRMISFYLNFNTHSGWDEGDSYDYDPQSGILKQQELQERKNLGEKWRNANYGIHTGGIYGLPTKILVCLGTLFCASLPITGFIIWWGRKKKKKKPKGKKIAVR